MKRPSFQWYPGDFRRDLGVQACSFEARALWREMLDLMHDGQPYGHLTAGGVPIDAGGLARLIGKSTPVVRRWLKELEDRRVFSRTDGGVIYSRRMVRDEAIRNLRASGGVKSLDNPNVPRPKHGEKDTEKDDHGGSFDRSSVGSPAIANAVASASAIEPVSSSAALAIRFAAAANRGLAEHADRPQPIPRIIATDGRTHTATEAIREAGVPPDFAVAELYRLAKSHDAEGEVSSLKYFAPGVIRAWVRQKAASERNGFVPPDPVHPKNGRPLTIGEQAYLNAKAAVEDL